MDSLSQLAKFCDYNFVIGQTIPDTKSRPTWKVIPGGTEVAVDGRNKTLYCLAIGR